MIKTRLRYCVYDPDPNGNDRYYVRKAGQPKIRIREAFEDDRGNITPEFMTAYFAALAALEGAKLAPMTPRDKTFYWLVDQYFRSQPFGKYDDLTKADKKGVLNRFCDEVICLIPHTAGKTLSAVGTRELPGRPTSS